MKTGCWRKDLAALVALAALAADVQAPRPGSLELFGVMDVGVQYLTAAGAVMRPPPPAHGPRRRGRG